MTLDMLKPNQTAKIKNLNISGSFRQRLLDMGFVPNTKITFVKSAPQGDPIEFFIRGYNIALRKKTAQNITVERII